MELSKVFQSLPRNALLTIYKSFIGPHLDYVDICVCVCVCLSVCSSKIISNGLHAFLYKLIPKKSHQYITRIVSEIAAYQCRTDAFKLLTFPWTITEWNIIDNKIWNSPRSVFKNYLLKEIRPQPSPLYNIHNPSGIKLLTRLRLGLSHLNEYKFNHNFDDCVNPFCTCSLEPESTSHLFLHCHHYNTIQSIFKDLNSVD